MKASITQEGLEEDLMIPEHEGYHHIISQNEAERRLRQNGGRCYLTRYSNTNKCYILSISQTAPTSTIRHFIIDKEKDGVCRIRGKQKEFGSIEELLAYYEENAIDPALRNIGKKYTEEDYTKDQKCCMIL